MPLMPPSLGCQLVPRPPPPKPVITGDLNVVSHSELVSLLLSLPADTAEQEAAALMARINFTSTYAFGKLLTEQLLDDLNTLPGVGKAIVRPSLITNVAGAPYPG